MRRFLVGAIVGAALALGVPGAVVWFGAVDMSASSPPSFLERTVGERAFDAWLERTAPDTNNPLGETPATLAAGLDHYRENCVVCHAAPDVEPTEIAEGLHPPAPRLWKKGTQSLSDGALFWTVKNGVRMTGMPAFGKTHGDEEIWKIVAFVRHLPNLTAPEKAALRSTR